MRSFRHAMTVWCALTLLVGVAAAAADAADGGRSRQPVSVAGSGEVARNALTTTPASADVVGAASSSATDDSSTAVEPPTTSFDPTTSVPFPGIPRVGDPPPVTLPPVIAVPGGPPPLSGVVVGHNGLPVSDLCVWVFATRVVSAPIAPDGFYVFNSLPPPTDAPGAGYSADVMECGNGAPAARTSITVWFTATPTVRNLTVYQGPLLSGIVYDNDDVPFAGVCVVEFSGPPGAPMLAPMITGLDGRFGPAESVSPGRYLFQVHPDCVTASWYMPDGRTTMTVDVGIQGVGYGALTVSHGVFPAPG